MLTGSNARCFWAVAAMALLGQGAQATDLKALEAAARAEGSLTTIAISHSWCGFGEVLEGFKKKYPEITLNELNPQASSADELEAIRANKGNMGPQAPDVIDVGLSFGPSAMAEGLLMPYKVATWDEIPDGIKDPDGHWYAGYYGVMSFIVNKDLVTNTPQGWSDLLKPEYQGKIALGGDPRTSNQAILAVMAAGMSTGASAGEEAAKAGLDFFDELNRLQNFVPVVGRAGALAQGTTPIVVAWDYNALAWEDALEGNPPVEIVIPDENVMAGVYVQAISAYAPHPNAAKLYMEYLYSDEGQLLWLKGYCHPTRFNSLVKDGKVPNELLERLPPAARYEHAYFPSLDEVNANSKIVTRDWDNVVGADVH